MPTCRFQGLIQLARFPEVRPVKKCAQRRIEGPYRRANRVDRLGDASDGSKENRTLLEGRKGTTNSPIWSLR